MSLAYATLSIQFRRNICLTPSFRDGNSISIPQFSNTTITNRHSGETFHSDDMAQNLIREYCQRQWNDLHNECEFFIPADHCRLLDDRELGAIFEKGPCQPYEILKGIVRGQLARYRDLLSPEDYVDSLAFELMHSIERNRLTKRPSLPALKQYLNQVGAHGVIKLLESLQLLTPKTCGNCIHLARSKPFLCHRETLDAHPQKDARQHPFYQTMRRPSERACKEGFESYIFEAEAPAHLLSAPFSGGNIGHVDMEHLLMLIEERAELAEGKKKKQRCERQFTIFSYLLHLFRQGYSQKEAFREILTLLDVTKKILRTDLQDIADFFNEKNVL